MITYDPNNILRIMYAPHAFAKLALSHPVRPPRAGAAWLRAIALDHLDTRFARVQMPDGGLRPPRGVAADPGVLLHLDRRVLPAAVAGTGRVHHHGREGARHTGHDTGLLERVPIQPVVRPVRAPALRPAVLQ